MKVIIVIPKYIIILILAFVSLNVSAQRVLGRWYEGAHKKYTGTFYNSHLIPLLIIKNDTAAFGEIKYKILMSKKQILGNEVSYLLKRQTENGQMTINRTRKGFKVFLFDSHLTPSSSVSLLYKHD